MVFLLVLALTHKWIFSHPVSEGPSESVGPPPFGHLNPGSPQAVLSAPIWGSPRVIALLRGPGVPWARPSTFPRSWPARCPDGHSLSREPAASPTAPLRLGPAAGHRLPQPGHRQAQHMRILTHPKPAQAFDENVVWSCTIALSLPRATGVGRLLCAGVLTDRDQHRTTAGLMLQGPLEVTVLRKGQLALVTQDRAQTAFERPHGGRSTAPLRGVFPC